MTIRRSIVALALTVVALLSLGVGSALGSYEPASPPSFRLNPNVENLHIEALAVDQSRHFVYASVKNNNTTPSPIVELMKFNEKGEPQEFAATKSNAVQVGTTAAFPTDVAVDDSTGPSSHDIYMTFAAHNEVVELNEAGEVVRTLAVETPTGVAVDATTGDVYVGQAVLGKGDVVEFSSTGEPLNGGNPVIGETKNLPAALSFNSSGDLYIEETSAAVVEFVTNGHGGFESPTTISGTLPRGLAVDQSTNDVFIASQVGSGRSVQEHSSTGVAIGEPLAVLGESNGLAISETTKAIYLGGGEGSDEVEVFVPSVAKQSLTVEVEGHGKVAGGGVACETSGAGSDQGTCSAEEPEGAEVVLMDTPESGWAFSKWEGCESTSGAECKVKMSKAQEVKAVDVEVHGLPLSVFVTGEGKVNGGGISECSAAGGAGCTATVEGVVTLTATHGAGYVLAGWLGCRKATADTCEVDVTAASEVTAVFLAEGKQGTPGETPLIAEFSGSQHGCAAGGLEIKVGASPTVYFCNGSEGKAGAAGERGAEGKAGAAGEKGAGGAAGGQGSAGAQGPAGPAGPAGREGAAGKVEIVTCTKVGKKKRCTTRTASGTFKLSALSARATLSRRGVVYATGATVRARMGIWGLRLNGVRALRPGRYTLTLVSGVGRGERVRSETLTVG
jgi:Divergent InlB B-repeat domain